MFVGMIMIYCMGNLLEQLGYHLVTCQHLKMPGYSSTDLRISVVLFVPNAHSLYLFSLAFDGYINGSRLINLL